MAKNKKTETASAGKMVPLSRLSHFYRVDLSGDDGSNFVATFRSVHADEEKFKKAVASAVADWIKEDPSGFDTSECDKGLGAIDHDLEPGTKAFAKAARKATVTWEMVEKDLPDRIARRHGFLAIVTTNIGADEYDGPSLEDMKNAIKSVEDIPCEVDETARAVLLDGVAMFKNVYGGGDNDYEVIVRDKKNGKFKSSDADLAAAAKCFVKYYKEHSVSTETPKKYDRVPFDELGKVSCDDWFHRPFKVKYGAAVVEFSRSDYFEHDAFLLTDGTMERLCLRIQEELHYYAEVDRIANEYASGQPDSTPTLDDLVDQEAHRLLVEEFGCPVGDDEMPEIQAGTDVFDLSRGKLGYGKFLCRIPEGAQLTGITGSKEHDCIVARTDGSIYATYFVNLIPRYEA